MAPATIALRHALEVGAQSGQQLTRTYQSLCGVPLEHAAAGIAEVIELTVEHLRVISLLERLLLELLRKAQQARPSSKDA